MRKPRKEPRPRAVVERRGGRLRRRMTIYFPPELARRLLVHCAREDREASEVVTDAVRRHLAAPKAS